MRFNMPAVSDQHGVRAVIAPSRVLTRDGAKLCPQGVLIRGLPGLPSLGGAVLACYLTRPTLGDAEAIAEHRDRTAPSGRAHQFPLEISFKARFSSSLSATRRFSWLFSFSSSLRRLASAAFIPPN